MVDIWLLFCVGITFLVILFHILIDNRLFSTTGKTEVKPLSITGAFITEVPPGLFRGRCRWSPALSVGQLEMVAKVFTFLLIVGFIIGYLSYIIR